MQGLREAALVVDLLGQAIELAVGTSFDILAPKLDELARSRWRLEPSEALAHHHGESVLEGRVGPLGDREKFPR